MVSEAHDRVQPLTDLGGVARGRPTPPQVRECCREAP